MKPTDPPTSPSKAVVYFEYEGPTSRFVPVPLQGEVPEHFKTQYEWPFRWPSKP